MSVSVAKAFSKPKHSLPELCPDLALPGAKIGIEIECEKVSSTRDLHDLWETKPDGSLKDRGMEFVTRGGLVGTAITTALSWFCSYAAKMKYSDAYPRGGIHIHLDVTDVNEDDPLELARILQTYMVVEPALFSFAGEHRRSCGFCDAYGDSEGDFSSVSKLLFGWGRASDSDYASLHRLLTGDGAFSKYQAVNLLPMAQFGTLEFRHLPTTFDYKRILTWINFILCIKRFAKEYTGSVPELASLGGGEFYERVFGRWLPDILPHYNEDKFREAIITAKLIQLRSTVRRFQVPKAQWPGKPSKFLKPYNKPKKVLDKPNNVPEPVLLLRARGEAPVENAIEDALVRNPRNFVGQVGRMDGARAFDERIWADAEIRAAQHRDWDEAARLRRHVPTTGIPMIVHDILRDCLTMEARPREWWSFFNGVWFPDPVDFTPFLRVEELE